MGEVYEGEHVETREPAAIKLLHRNVLSDPAQVQRFTREVRMAASLASPNVVRVLEVADPSAPLPYLAMERMRGHDLAHTLRRKGKLPLSDVCDLVTQIARGLMAARGAGIVHRDLKPQNLFAARQEDGGVIWKVMDFGVSKLVETGDTLTKGHVVGTPTYMSPEQARGKKVDHRSDVYALGAIAYRAITGHPAFSGREVLEVLHKVVKRMPVRPSTLLETLHPDVDRALALGLAKRPRKRFETAEEFAQALRAAVRGELSDALRQRADALMQATPWAAET
jgi:serine/threonine-protein kinase